MAKAATPSPVVPLLGQIEAMRRLLQVFYEAHTTWPHAEGVPYYDPAFETELKETESIIENVRTQMYFDYLRQLEYTADAATAVIAMFQRNPALQSRIPDERVAGLIVQRERLKGAEWRLLSALTTPRRTDK